MKITVYGTPTCPYTSLVREHLKRRGLKFSFRNTALSDRSARRVFEISGQYAVPVIDVDQEVVVGWNEEAIDFIIAKKQNV